MQKPESKRDRRGDEICGGAVTCASAAVNVHIAQLFNLSVVSGGENGFRYFEARNLRNLAGTQTRAHGTCVCLYRASPGISCIMVGATSTEEKEIVLAGLEEVFLVFSRLCSS